MALVPKTDPGRWYRWFPFIVVCEVSSPWQELPADPDCYIESGIFQKSRPRRQEYSLQSHAFLQQHGAKIHSVSVFSFTTVLAWRFLALNTYVYSSLDILFMYTPSPYSLISLNNCQFLPYVNQHLLLPVRGSGTFILPSIRDALSWANFFSDPSGFPQEVNLKPAPLPFSYYASAACFHFSSSDAGLLYRVSMVPNSFLVLKKYNPFLLTPSLLTHISIPLFCFP